MSEKERQAGEAATREPTRGQAQLPNELAASIAGLSPAQLEALHLHLNKLNKNGKQSARPRITRQPRESNAFPLSFAQQRLWFMEQLTPSTGTYNIASATRLTGRLDVDALERSLNEIVRRHEALRTTFTTKDGQAVQVIADSLTLPVRIIDLRELDESARETRARFLINEEAKQPFDLTKGPLLRADLMRMADSDESQEHILLLIIHHIVSDKWSQDVLLRELVRLYDAFSHNRPSPLPELPFQYPDFAQWQREYLSEEVIERQLAFWRKQLADAAPHLNLPTDHPRQAEPTVRGARHHLAFAKELVEEVEAFSRREGVTFYITALAAFNTLLHLYTRQTDILVGTSSLGRGQPEAEALIGFFVNTLVLRTDLSGDPTFRELLARVQQMMLDSHAHRDLPFEKLVEGLRVERDPSRHPLFQVMFNLQTPPAEGLSMPELNFRSIEADNGTVKFDLTIFLLKSAAGLTGYFVYKRDLFEPATITRLTEDYETLLHCVAQHPDAGLPSLGELLAQERARKQSAKREEMKRANREKLKTLGKARSTH